MLTIPNVLTLLRLLAVPVFLYASFHGDFGLAFILFIAAALTDILDGWIARASTSAPASGPSSIPPPTRP
jgi:Phosphatidylglycerophosphate synthase